MRYACLFPGQGSQQVGMGKDVSTRWSVAREVFQQANAVLDFDLSKLCFTGPQTRLTATEYAQPAILTTSVALFRVLEDEGIVPHAVAGHSIGSFAALVAAGSLTFADAVQIVRQRGLLMAAVQQKGSMLAVVSASEDKLVEVVNLARQTYALDVAAYNSPVQTVFSGSEDAIQGLQDYLADKSGVQARRFAVSHAFHSRLMNEKKEQWAEFLGGFSIAEARIPVGLNVSGIFSTNPLRIRDDLIEQFTSPVQWRPLFTHLIQQTFDQYIEVGMGRTLAGLARAWPEKPQVQTTESAAGMLKLMRLAPVAQPQRSTLRPAA